MSKKPLSWCWTYFERKHETNENGNAFVAGYCKFCNKRYKSDAAKMEKHLENCNKVGSEARNQIDRLSKRPAARRSRSLSPKSKIPKLSEVAEISSQGNSGSIKHWFESISKDDEEELDILLTRAFATGNIAPNFLDNPFFQRFIAKLRPSYKLPSRNYKYPKVLVPSEFSRAKKSLEDSTNKADFLAISSDGWTDVRSNSIINVVVHTPKPFLFDSIDVTSTEVDGIIERTQHSGNFIAGLLADQIIQLGKHKIVAVVTDHAANMRSAWKKLAGEDPDKANPAKKYTGETFPWILFEGCKAHMIDLAAKDVCGKTRIKNCLEYCVKVAKFFRKKTPELILSKAQQEQSGSSAILKLPVKTRWGTWAMLVSSIASNEVALKSAICAPGILNDQSFKLQAERLRKILWESEDFWLDVKDIQNILSPLAAAITGIEGNQVNSRRCYQLINDAFAKSRTAVEGSGFLEEIKEELIILESRKEFGQTDVAFLLDILEPSDKGQMLSNDKKQSAIKLLKNKILKNPVFAGKEEKVKTELGQWLSGTGIFSMEKRSIAWDTVNTMDSLAWWTAWFDDTLLSKVVRMLHNVPISAAPTERN